MSDSGLSTKQVETHLANLASTANFIAFPLLVETILYGLFTILIVTSSYILITRGLRTQSSRILFAITLIMYAISSLDWAIDVHNLRTQLKVLLPSDVMNPPPDVQSTLKVNTALRIVQATSSATCSLFADAVLCWRVYVVYNQSKGVLAQAVLLMVALATGIILCCLSQVANEYPSVPHIHFLGSKELVIDIITLALSAIVNIWATSMIAWRAWQCRRDIREYCREYARRSLTESVLTLFIETGIIYTILWILKNIILLPNLTHTAYVDYAGMIMYQIIGMYPTLIIVLVALQKSHLEHQFTYHGKTGERTGPLAFSPQQPVRVHRWTVSDVMHTRPAEYDDADVVGIPHMHSHDDSSAPDLTPPESEVKTLSTREKAAFEV